jgi:hypothetical protein
VGDSCSPYYYGEVLNLLDNNPNDLAYWYESYIDGFDAAPTEGPA